MPGDLASALNDSHNTAMAHRVLRWFPEGGRSAFTLLAGRADPRNFATVATSEQSGQPSSCDELTIHVDTKCRAPL